ncbi:hypothetical protein [Desulfobacter vibrioformis]|uniref:hypothetical protein n=1 Tax=Desulfobacter vibrioformis TaxID=34031 RepID=UPI0005546F33|nr:hypothetical protein [Desulfobacter vibrioformis]
MECKGCGKAFEESELKTVGPWQFCPPCFEKLMAGPPPAEPGEQEEISPPLVITGEQARCAVCDIVLEEGAGKDMGILTVCPDCYQELITKPEPVKIQERDPEDAPETSEEPDIPWQDPMETVPCTQCRRTIKKVAAKIYQDKPYCPDCFYQNNYQNPDPDDQSA